MSAPAKHGVQEQTLGKEAVQESEYAGDFEVAFLNHLYCGMEEPEMKTIDVIICRLRKKLAAAGVPTLIDTVWGCGYILRDPSLVPQVISSESVWNARVAVAA